MGFKMSEIAGSDLSPISYLIIFDNHIISIKICIFIKCIDITMQLNENRIP